MENEKSRRIPSYTSASKKEVAKNYYIIDIPAYIFIVVVFIYLAYIFTNYSQSSDPDKVSLSNKALIASMMAVIGFAVLNIVNTSVSEESRIVPVLRDYEQDTLEKTLTFVFIGTAVISVGNYISSMYFKTPFTGTAYSITGTDVLTFYIAMAIVEELMFTFLFQITFEQLSSNSYIGIGVRAFAFMIFHSAVYNQQLDLLASTFIGGLVLASTFKLSKRLSVNIMIHIFTNIIATWVTVGLVFSVI